MAEDVAGRIRDYVDRHAHSVADLGEDEAVGALLDGMWSSDSLRGWTKTDLSDAFIDPRDHIRDRLRKLRGQ